MIEVKDEVYDNVTSAGLQSIYYDTTAAPWLVEDTRKGVRTQVLARVWSPLWPLILRHLLDEFK